MDYKDSIEKTKQGFEESFKVDSYYNKQTGDKKHLELIMNCLQVETGMKILDLGTGTGYLAFPFAIGKLSGLNYITNFETIIRFPKKREAALEFDDIISRHDEAVIRGYDVEIIDDEIWITEKVNNLLFQKC